MTHTPHELHEEFPEHAERMHALKGTDAHFRKLFEEYHDVNRAIHRAETRAEPISEFEEERLRKNRALLKDQIARILATTDTSAGPGQTAPA